MGQDAETTAGGVMSASNQRSSLLNWLFRDRRSGRIVIAQWPNIPLAVWLVASVVRAVLRLDGGWGAATSTVATVALGWWAIDEMARGVNPWRRLLGTLVLAALALTQAMRLL